MHIFPRVFVTLNVLLLTRQTIQTVPNRTSSESSDVQRLVAEMIQSDQNSSIIFDENGNPRDKRALGVLLQGLVQAFGYNAKPVQLASLPNPNTIGTMAAGPVNIDIRQVLPPVTPAAPMLPPPPPPLPVPPPPRPTAAVPAAAAAPRQKETLRFTGVFNFGNNSDILGHLRTYEQLFHGSSTVRPPRPPQTPQPAPPPAPAPAPASIPAQTQAPAINPRNAQTRPPLLEPYFVPIPIPLSPNIQNLQDLQYPPTLVSLVTSNSVTPNSVVTPVNYPPTVVKEEYVNKEHEEISNVESEQIIGDRNPNLDDRRNNHKKIESNQNREEEIVQKRPADVENDHEEDADKSPDDNQHKAENTDDNHDDEETDEVYADGESEDETSQTSNTDEPAGETREDTKREQQSDHHSDSSENESEPDEYSQQDVSEEEQSSSQKFPLSASKEPSESKKVSSEDAEDYIPRRIPSYYTIKLPIEDKPFHGPFMNSYGQSLEHSGKIDENVADYFRQYKNSQSGLFDAQSIITPQIQKRPWWIEGVPREPIERIHNDYKIPLQNKYEEYNLNTLNNRKSQEAADTEKPSNERIEKEESRVPDQKSTKRSKSKSQKIEPRIVETINNRLQRKPLPLIQFDFVKHTPYYKPVQYFFSPESLQRSTQSILTHRNSQHYRKPPETLDSRDTQEELPEQSSVTAKVDKSAAIRIPEKLTGRRLPQGETKDIKHWPGTSRKPKIVNDHSSSKAPQHQDFENSSEGYSDDQPESTPDQTLATDYRDSPESHEEAYSENPKVTDETPAPKYYYSARSPSQEADDPQPETETPIRQSQHYESKPPAYSHDSESGGDYSEDSGQREYQTSDETSGSGYDPEQRDVDEEPKPNRRTHQKEYIHNASSSRNREPTDYRSSEPKLIDEPPMTADLDDESEEENQQKDVNQQRSSPEIKIVRDVPITTFNPITYRLPSKSLNDDRRNTIPRSQIIQYGFPDIKNDANVRQAYIPYSAPSALYSTYPNSDEPIPALDDYIFGQKIGPSLEVGRDRSDVDRNYNIDANKNSEDRVSTPKIVEAMDNLESRRFFITDNHPPIVREPNIGEFKSANSERYKSHIVSDKSRGDRAFDSQGPDIAYRYY